MVVWVCVIIVSDPVWELSNCKISLTIWYTSRYWCKMLKLNWLTYLHVYHWSQTDYNHWFWLRSHETFNVKSLLRMSQSAMSRAIQCILISINYSYVYLTKLAKNSKNSETVLSQIRKTTKNHPLDVAKKYVETYSLSNPAARGPEERAFHN